MNILNLDIHFLVLKRSINQRDYYFEDHYSWCNKSTLRNSSTGWRPMSKVTLWFKIMQKKLVLFANREYRIRMILKPQDIVIALKILSCEQAGLSQWSYSQLAAQLFMSPSEVHAGVKRAIQSRLLDINRKPVRRALGELLIHGVKYVFPADYGGIVRGMPTRYAGPPINKHILSADTTVPVWPHPDGDTQGMAFLPIYKSVPDSCMLDSVLYEYLVITDALRGGKARERQIAGDELIKRLSND